MGISIISNQVLWFILASSRKRDFAFHGGKPPPYYAGETQRTSLFLFSRGGGVPPLLTSIKIETILHERFTLTYVSRTPSLCEKGRQATPAAGRRLPGDFRAGTHELLRIPAQRLIFRHKEPLRKRPLLQNPSC